MGGGEDRGGHQGRAHPDTSPPCSPGAQGLPSGIHIGVEVLFRGLPRADAVARVVVGKDVAADPGTQADVETAHLAQVDGIAVGEQDREPGVGRGSGEGGGKVKAGPIASSNKMLWVRRAIVGLHGYYTKSGKQKFYFPLTDSF